MNATGRATFGLVLGVALLAATCPGEILEFRDKDEWVAAVGDYTTIDFTGHTSGERITYQYADLGITFTDCYITYYESDMFNDWWGVDGNTGIHLEFDTPQLWIATDFPGSLRIELFKDGALLYASLDFGYGGPGWFAGLLSASPFDEVLIYDDNDSNVVIDDLHFGIPTPGALPLIVSAFLFTGRRRA